MRRRISFVRDHDVDELADIETSSLGVTLDNVKAVRQDQWTGSFDELDVETLSALRDVQSLSIQWVSPTTPFMDDPFPHILPAGLHITFLPKRPGSYTAITPLIQNLTSMAKINDVFTPSLSGAMTFSVLAGSEIPKTMLALILRLKCPQNAHMVSSIAQVDINFDAPNFRVSVVLAPRAWTTTIKDSHQQTELGVFRKQGPAQNGLTSMKGALLQVGTDSKFGNSTAAVDDANQLEPTFLTSTPRHLTSGDTYKVDFAQPVGLHPTLEIHIPRVERPAKTCKLFAHLRLPVMLFLDVYQLRSAKLLESHNLRSLTGLSGARDLEAPEWALTAWGSSVLVEIAPPKESQSFRASIPLHLRYSTNGSKIYNIHRKMASPRIFWTCNGDSSQPHPFSQSPVDYESRLPVMSQFHHLRATASITEVVIPVMDTKQASKVETWTMVCIVLGFLWVCNSLRKAWTVDIKDESKKD